MLSEFNLFYKNNEIIFCVNCNHYNFFFDRSELLLHKGISEFVAFYALFVSCFCFKIELHGFFYNIFITFFITFYNISL